MPNRSTVLTIGNFDGVHLGHQALVKRARSIADAGAQPGRVVALTFDPHPVTVLAPKRARPALSTFAQRAAWLAQAGADDVIPLAPTPELLALTPEQFVDRLVEKHAPTAIVEGEDFRFGHRRAGDIETLRDLGAQRGFDVHVLEPVTVALTDQTIVTASSTITRWLLGNGRVGDAARVLGRCYELAGTVGRGDRRGRELGFPTANLRVETLTPCDAVYAARAILPGGRCLPSAVHIGPRATFDLPERTVEAHVIGWPGPLSEGTKEYGWPLALHLVAWLRGQARFDSVPDLVDQMGRDVERALEVIRLEAMRGCRCDALQEADA